MLSKVKKYIKKKIEKRSQKTKTIKHIKEINDAYKAEDDCQVVELPDVRGYNSYITDPKYLQISHMTKPQRFPIIFDTVKKLKPDAKRILSFGCSTGQEAFELARLFPESEIVGVDIDYQSVVTARRNNPEPDRIHFHTDLGATGKYDLVLGLMVFFSMEPPVPFKSFEYVLKDLDKHINEKALLTIYTSDHDPEWLQFFYESYEPYRVWKRVHNRNNKEYYNGYWFKK